jgi:uncharacterized coiled-coil DUF342 family protein
MSDDTGKGPDDQAIHGAASAAQTLLEQLAQKKDELEKLISSTAERITEIDGKAAELTESLSRLRTEQEAIAGIRSTANAELNAIKDNATKTKEALDGIEASHGQFDALRSEAETARTKLADQQSTLAGEIEALDKGKAHAQELVSDIATLKASAAKESATINDFTQSFVETKAKLDSAAQSAEEARKRADASEASLGERITSLGTVADGFKTKADALGNVLSDVERLRDEALKGKEAVIADSQQVGEAKARFEELRAQTQAAHDALTNQNNVAATQIEQIGVSHATIEKMRSELADERQTDAGAVPSIFQSIKDIHDLTHSLLSQAEVQTQEAKTTADKTLSDIASTWDGIKADHKLEQTTLLTTAKMEIDTLKTNLEQEIRRLLPGAGAAGLASAYFDAKSKYGPTKFDYTGKETEKHHRLKYLFALFGYVVSSYATPLIFYAMFIMPLAIVAYFFHDLLEYFKTHPSKFDPSLFLFRVAISVPLLTISYFGWSSIRLYRRLYEEYNHKQRVMELYESFKKEAEKIGTPEQQTALLGIMLATVGDKPSLAMHKYDEGIEKAIPAISLGSIANLLGLGSKPKESE